MSHDTMKVFDSFLREWCEQRGWPYQPEMTAGDKLNAQEYWAEIEGTDEWELATLTEIEENDD